MTFTRPGNHRRLRRLLGWVAVLAAVWLLLPVSAGGRSDYVITHGTSMEPGFHTGDLAIVRAAGTYRVGDVVAYRSESLHTTVMHRIVAVQDGRYVFKGDNNTFVDPEHPRAEQLIGTLVLRIPQGGTWLGRVTHPAALALASLVLLTAGTRVRRHRDRRRRRSATMSHPRRVRSRAVAAAMSTATGRAALTAAAALAALGVLLALVAWKAPRDVAGSDASTPAATTTFAYHATVPRTPAYDADTVTSPDPVFRRLTNHVDLDVRYVGPPGTRTIVADVTAGNGWHTTLPLLPATPVTTSSHDATVALDLEQVEQRAKDAAQVIGMPYQSLTLAVHARVRTADGQHLTPTLTLLLTPTQLKLAGGPDTLTVTSPPAQPAPQAPTSTVRVLGQPVSTPTAALTAAAVLAAAALLVLLALLLGARRPLDEAEAIHARYRDLLLPVQPPATSHPSETVDVQDFTALARTAHRYGLVILTWHTPEGHTFVVQDQAVRYRYTTAVPQRRRARSRRSRSR